MPEPTIGLADLRRILRASAGAELDAGLDGEILDTSFDELGYDSLAIMETVAKIRQEYGVLVGDDDLPAATTPRRLLALVNRG